MFPETLKNVSMLQNFRKKKCSVRTEQVLSEHLKNVLFEQNFPSYPDLEKDLRGQNDAAQGCLNSM